jgi:hydrogenase expression/formation protein HypC
MCLAIPMRITAIEDGVAAIVGDGLEQRASLALVPDAGVGDYVLVHAGYALTVLDEAEARERLSLFAELEQFDDDVDG